VGLMGATIIHSGMMAKYASASNLCVVSSSMTAVILSCCPSFRQRDGLCGGVECTPAVGRWCILGLSAGTLSPGRQPARLHLVFPLPGGGLCFTEMI